MVTYIILTGGKSTRPGGGTNWGAQSVSQRTGWSWRSCNRYIGQLEAICMDTGEAILTRIGRNGDIIKRVPSQVENIIIPRSLMSNHGDLESPIYRLFHTDRPKKDKCLALVTLIDIYRSYDESAACCHSTMAYLIEPNLDLEYGELKGALVATEAMPNMDYQVVGLSHEQTATAVRILFEEGLVRNIFIVLEKDSVAYIARATSKYHRSLFGDFQEAVRAMDWEIRYCGFNHAEYSGGYPIHWLGGELIQSITPAFLTRTDILLDSMDGFIEHMEEELECFAETVNN